MSVRGETRTRHPPSRRRGTASRPLPLRILETALTSHFLPRFLIPVMYQKRLKKERRARKRLQEQLDLEIKRRTQLEEALKATGASSEQVRAITGKYRFRVKMERERRRLRARARSAIIETSRSSRRETEKERRRERNEREFLSLSFSISSRHPGFSS